MGLRCDVLIVEDDYDIREVLTEVLQDEGYEVSGAANGREALDLLHRLIAAGRSQDEGNNDVGPRLILLDLMMPVMSGWQFVAEQRQTPEIKDIPVVVVSADGNLQQKATSLGASGYLRKPIEIDALLNIVSRYCNKER
ncbi:MAG: response regulator [Myxococcales bacterium]|jgi:CheY-like chemotaxis protein